MAPTPHEWTCYRKGTLIFSNCTSVTVLKEMSTVSPALGASGEADYGHIETFEPVGSSSYRLVGEFGNVLITSSEPDVKFIAD
ncbi:MAG: hypothetical protein AAF974_12125 [Cyanobacteria bacterium P01_E01_bin.34]